MIPINKIVDVIRNTLDKNDNRELLLIKAMWNKRYRPNIFYIIQPIMYNEIIKLIYEESHV